MHKTLVGILIGFTVISLSRKGTLVCVWKNLSPFDLIPIRNVSIQASSNVMNMSWYNVVIQQSCCGFETIAWPIAKPHITCECWWLSSCGETRCTASLFSFLSKILRAWSNQVWRSPGTWSGRWCEAWSVLVRLGEARRDLRQREGRDWACRGWTRWEVRDGAQTIDIQRRLALKDLVPVFRSRGDMRRHKTVWDGGPGLMTRSPEWGDTPVMMTRGVRVPMCPRSCENAEVIFKRVTSTFIF